MLRREIRYFFLVTLSFRDACMVHHFITFILNIELTILYILGNFACFLSYADICIKNLHAFLAYADFCKKQEGPRAPDRSPESWHMSR